MGTFGIDSNVFSSNYKAPSKSDHIGVAMVHVDGKKKKSGLKSVPKAHLTILSGTSDTTSIQREIGSY